MKYADAFGDVFDIIICQSAIEVQRNLEHHAQGAVLPLGMNGAQRNSSGDVDKLIENIVSTGPEEKPLPKTLADRVDLLEQKIIESTLHSKPSSPQRHGCRTRYQPRHVVQQDEEVRHAQLRSNLVKVST